MMFVYGFVEEMQGGFTPRRAVRRRTMTQKSVDWNAKRTIAYPMTVIHDTHSQGSRP